MSTDPTEAQGGRELQQSLEMSLQRGHPPVDVPGYEPERFLGVGAYGEVWVARERNTGRRVAIKFYAHRSGLDWSLLSREVEKLAFLFADRYVVQLLGVGWDAEPPYYIMEYLERGSLAEYIHQGPLPVAQAVELFRDVAVGLVHAHDKGVLHCDLKPANILLDQDNKPRLADFGQSRLSTEQIPALGTLFYMAPEQADLEAIPHAQWDVYALGALLYCMLTGSPPHRKGHAIEHFDQATSLVDRLARYRRMIEESPQASGHRQVRGVDRALGDIVDRCLAPDPQKRFPNVQAVLAALDVRAARRARLPMMVLGAVGPALLMVVVLWFAWQGFGAVMQHSDVTLTRSALKSNSFAAQYVARTAGNEFDRRYRAVEQMADDDQFRQLLVEVASDPDLEGILAQLADPNLEANLQQTELDALRGEFQESLHNKKLQRRFAELIPHDMKPQKKENGGERQENGKEEVASWFFCDATGVSLFRFPEGRTIGGNFAWRSYYHSGPDDVKESWRPKTREDYLPDTSLSAIFPSRATERWIMAVSTPVYEDSSSEKVLGVLALTVEVGRFAEMQDGDHQFAVLVDWRKGEHQGVILQHPLFDDAVDDDGKLPLRFRDKKYRLVGDHLPTTYYLTTHYEDPMAKDHEGAKYRKQWLAQMELVRARGQDTGLRVIVQQSYDDAIGSTLTTLRTELIRRGLIALVLIAVVMVITWWCAARLSAVAAGTASDRQPE